MFCPACGAANEEAARFCNQCGARIASMQPVSSTQQGAPATPPQPVPSTATADPGAAPRIPTGMGTTGDRISLPMVGPSRRALVLAGTGIGVACLCLGALVAWKTIPRAPPPPPPTTVDLVGDPAEVTPTVMTDAGISEPAPRARAPRTATRTATATPSRAPAAAPSRAANGTTPRTNGGATVAANTATNTNAAANGGDPAETHGASNGPAGSNGGAAPSATPSRAAAGGSLPVDSQGVIERGPQQTVGGFRQGDETDATGTMDPSVFRFVYQHYRSQISACYSSATRAHEISGVIVVRVRIAEDGHVARTRVISDNTSAPGLAACVQTAIRGWRYPQPEGGEVEVDYPLRMGSGAQL